MASTNHGRVLSFLKCSQFEPWNWLNQIQIYQRCGHILATAGEMVHDGFMQQLFAASTSSLLWHQGAIAEPLWCSESDPNLTYRLCSFVTSQEVKKAWAALASMILVIDQMYRVQFVASCEQLRLSAVSSNWQHCLKWERKQCLLYKLWS